jgi:NitT/TauT family transport system substrate-binding protein
MLIGLAALTSFGARAGDGAPLAIRLVLERPIDGSMAPLVLADSRGLFGAERVTVTTTSAKGPADAIARVAAGEADLALADINELVRFHDDAGKPPVKAVFVLFNRAPYAIVARRSRDIHTLSDLDGKTVGVADGDLSIRLWPAVARHNAIKTAELKFAKVGAAVREPILSAGQVDAVTGFSYLSAVNLRDRGVPASDLAVLNFSDYGCEAYGLAVIASPAFAAAHPEAVRGFVRALIGGLHLSISDPAAAAATVVSRMDDGSRELELERLKTVLAGNILTPEVRRNGIGGIDPSRMERAIDQIGEEHKFHQRPGAADIFDDSFLPPVNGRLIN